MICLNILKFMILTLFKGCRLEIKCHTSLNGEGARIHVVVDAAKHFGVNTWVLRHREDIGGTHVSTTAEEVVFRLEGVTQRDIIALQEGCVVYEVVREDVVIG